jgi:hypothetical protein
MERATAAARKAEQHTRELEGAFRREHADNLIKRQVVTLSSFLGLIPGIGTLVGSGGVAVVGGATTYAVGEVLVHHFERGGTLLDIDVKALKGRFQREIKRGRDVAVSLVRK